MVVKTLVSFMHLATARQVDMRRLLSLGVPLYQSFFPFVYAVVYKFCLFMLHSTAFSCSYISQRLSRRIRLERGFFVNISRVLNGPRLFEK